MVVCMFEFNVRVRYYLCCVILSFIINMLIYRYLIIIIEVMVLGGNEFILIVLLLVKVIWGFFWNCFCIIFIGDVILGCIFLGIKYCII